MSELLSSAAPVTLPSGATILVPAGWRAEETTGLTGPLPYLSDSAMAIIVYLISRQQGASVGASLGAVQAIAGADNPTQVLQEVDEARGVGIVVWDQVSGGMHHVLVGDVRGSYVGILATTSAFCPKETAYTATEARAFADFLDAIVASYRNEKR
ncbi:MAG: hypothetical protein ACUVWR_15550 [Anaerolineae bacterium]